MLYGVCLRYKESVNCRLEANYGLQQASLSQVNSSSFFIAPLPPVRALCE